MLGEEKLWKPKHLSHEVLQEIEGFWDLSTNTEGKIQSIYSIQNLRKSKDKEEDICPNWMWNWTIGIWNDICRTYVRGTWPRGKREKSAQNWLPSCIVKLLNHHQQKNKWEWTYGTLLTCLLTVMGSGSPNDNYPFLLNSNQSLWILLNK